MKKYIAEMIGTMVLVLMGCGSAVFAGSVTGTVGAGVGTVGRYAMTLLQVRRTGPLQTR